MSALWYQQEICVSNFFRCIMTLRGTPAKTARCTLCNSIIFGQIWREMSLNTVLCQATNAAARKPPGYSQPHPISSTLVPGFARSLDFLTLPETAEGYNTCFVATDRLSKAVVLAAMRMDPTHPLDSIATAQVIFEKMYSFFGIPRELTSNTGPQFISQVWCD